MEGWKILMKMRSQNVTYDPDVIISTHIFLPMCHYLKTNSTRKLTVASYKLIAAG